MAGVLAVASVLLAAGIFTRLEVFFLLLYLVLGVYGLSKLWVGVTHRGLQIVRRLPSRVFLGENIDVTISIRNSSFLPIPWLSLRETLPPELATYEVLRKVTALRPRGREDIAYSLVAGKRGYHPVGPLAVTLGDVFGFARREIWLERPVNVIVYPEIVPLGRLGLPSTTPFGAIKTTKMLYQDPARVVGAREYKPPDSPRMINWKLTAAKGSLFVRQLEPAVSHEVLIFVDLNPGGYSPEWLSYASELSIVVAASIASRLIAERQTVGLVANGIDRVLLGGRALPAETARSLRGPRAPGVPPGKGRRHLMAILDLLARIGLLPGGAIEDQVRGESVKLSWGSTLVVVSGKGESSLLEALMERKRAGHNAVAIFTDPATARASCAKATAAAIESYAVTRREGMDVWRDHRAAS